MRRFFTLTLVFLIVFVACASKQSEVKQFKKGYKSFAYPLSEEALQDPGAKKGKTMTEAQELFSQGIDFAAGGSEPSWSLRIDFDKVIMFSAQDGLDISTPPVTGTKAMDANVTYYHAITESGELRITISAERCRDSLSGTESGYLARIEARRSSESSFRSYKGCGSYIFDYRLHDIWVLQEATGVTLDTSRLMKGLPVFEFNPEESKVTGHTGCNNFNTRIEVRGDKLTFGRIISTRMACPDMSAEMSIVSLIEGGTFRYKIDEGGLTLESESGKMMSFRKVD